MNSIVGVRFQDKFKEGEFYGREYNYYSSIDLSPGDIVVVPTAKGDGIAKVISTDVPESKIDERILPLLKTIDKLYAPEITESEDN